MLPGQVGGVSHRASPSRGRALHSCPHATVHWSPMGGGTRQYNMELRPCKAPSHTLKFCPPRQSRTTFLPPPPRNLCGTGITPTCTIHYLHLSLYKVNSANFDRWTIFVGPAVWYQICPHLLLWLVPFREMIEHLSVGKPCLFFTCLKQILPVTDSL